MNESGGRRHEDSRMGGLADLPNLTLCTSERESEVTVVTACMQ